MFFKKNKVEVVPESQYTNYGEESVTKKQLAVAMCVPTVASIGLVAFERLNRVTETVAAQPVSQALENHNAITANYSPMPVNSFMDKAGEVSGQLALDTFTTVMKPILDILVALSFPVASVITVGALFMIMFGGQMKEKAFGILMNCGLGYVLIQMSPLLLRILEMSGKAVQPQ